MSSEYCYGVRESLKKIDVQLEHFNRIGAHNIQTSDIIYVLAELTKVVKWLNDHVEVLRV